VLIDDRKAEEVGTHDRCDHLVGRDQGRIGIMGVDEGSCLGIIIMQKFKAWVARLQRVLVLFPIQTIQRFVLGCLNDRLGNQASCRDTTDRGGQLKANEGGDTCTNHHHGW